MKFLLYKDTEYSGDKCTIYQVKIAGHEECEFDEFVNACDDDCEEEIANIDAIIYDIGHIYGAREGFFKLHEGKAGDRVCALFDDNKKLRVYCIRYSKALIVLGGGGIKTTRTWEEDGVLRKAVHRMQLVSDKVFEAMKDKDIELLYNEIIGKLTFDDYE